MFLPALTVVLLFANAVEENPEFKQGVQLYQDLEFEQSLFRFQKLTIQPGFDNGERARVLVWVALSYAGMGNEKSAKRAFADAIDLDKDASLPSFAPPKVKEWLADVRIERTRAALKAGDETKSTDATASPTEPTTTSSPDENPKTLDPKSTSAPGEGSSTAEPAATESSPDSQPTEKASAYQETEIEVTAERPVESSGPNLFFVGAGGAMLLVGVVSVAAALIFAFDYAANIEPAIRARQLLVDADPNNEARLAELDEAETLGLLDVSGAVLFSGLTLVGVIGGGTLLTVGLIE